LPTWKTDGLRLLLMGVPPSDGPWEVGPRSVCGEWPLEEGIGTLSAGQEARSPAITRSTPPERRLHRQ
jgi:hypothetical protein